MELKVFKFGGASVNSADAVKNATSIIKLFPDNRLMVIISAMGKTTNNLEKLLEKYLLGKDYYLLLNEIKDYHLGIITQLWDNNIEQEKVLQMVNTIFDNLMKKLDTQPTGNYDYEYDQLVSYGELLSTTIVSAYWQMAGVSNKLLDAREYVKTDDNYRNAAVDWAKTEEKTAGIHNLFEQFRVLITQGFIGGDGQGNATTLGREGSDYSAAIFAYCLNAKEMTIWKDVPGLLNADPKYFTQTQKLDYISYRDAIELAYYGATIIHPKTIKPLQNKNIELRVRSFVNPTEEGSLIGDFTKDETTVIPCFIFKTNQVLITISPKDFSFIAEENLCDIFAIFAKNNVKINLMQNSAISFSVCIDGNTAHFEELIPLLQQEFNVRYNTGLELITIRYYDQETIDRVLGNKTTLLELKSRFTAQIVAK